MSKQALPNAQVIVNGVDFSDHVKDVSIETTRDEIDVTAMGASNKAILLGLGDVTINVTAYQDFAAGSIDSVLFPLSTTNTPFTVEVRPAKIARSATNPAYVITALLASYNPIAGSPQDALTTPLAFRNAADTGLQRLVA